MTGVPARSSAAASRAASDDPPEGAVTGFVGPPMEIGKLPLWERMQHRRRVVSFELELTARCNNDCPHCFINLPAGDTAARARELVPAEIGRIADEAVDLGALWVLLTGGEPLLREDFAEIYLLLKRKGLLVSVFTNAILIRPEHASLFRAYPPRDLEVTVYGATRETYERVTRRPGSWGAFRRGLRLLAESGVPVRLKAMALRSNCREFERIAAFCRERTRDYFRFDPLLHLRYDGDAARNAEIAAERLAPEEVAALELADGERSRALAKRCRRLNAADPYAGESDRLFRCGAGNGSFSVSHDGIFRLCSSLWAPGTVYDLRAGTLREAWDELVPRVRDLRSRDPEFMRTCAVCPLINLCLWCPATAYLECGAMDARIEAFCRVAHVRAAAFGYRGPATRPADGEAGAE